MSTLSEESIDIEEAKKVLAKVSIKSQPKILIELNRLARSEDVSFDVVSDLVSQDVGLSAKLLKLASSPHYSKGNTFDSVHAALMAIGFEDFRTCFTSVSLQDFLTGMGYAYKGFWDHSRQIAYFCQELAGTYCRRLENQAYTLGLFHDVGAVLIPLHNRSYVQYIDRTLPLYVGITESEFKWVKTNHCVVGEIFGKTWSLDEAILDALRYHHRADWDTSEKRDTEILRAILQLAEIINDRMQSGADDYLKLDIIREVFSTIQDVLDVEEAELPKLEQMLTAGMGVKLKAL